MNINIGSSLSSFRNRFWLSNRNRKKQTITTIGIPMWKAKQNQAKNKENNNPQKSVNTESKQKTKTDGYVEEKEREISESPVLSPKLQGVQRNVALSPAQFIQNAGSKKTQSFDIDQETNDTVDDIPMYTIDDGKMDEEALQKWIDSDDYDDGDITMDGDFNADDNDQNKNHAIDTNLDLTIIGKQIAYLFDAVPVDPKDDDTDNDNGKIKEADAGNFAHSLNDTPLYIAQPFNGLDIKEESEWEKCLNNNKQNENALLIIELYSKMFGPSNVMYSMIDEILYKKKQENNKIEFVRLSSEKLNEIDIIKQIINDYQCFISTPIPTYIFIKNGKKIDLLKGTQPTEFEKLIDEYSKNKEESNQGERPKKYKSILKDRESFLFVTNANKENKSQASNVENIKNLIKNLDIDPNQTTKLSKKNKNSISHGTSTQSMSY